MFELCPKHNDYISRFKPGMGNMSDTGEINCFYSSRKSVIGRLCKLWILHSKPTGMSFLTLLQYVSEWKQFLLSAMESWPSLLRWAPCLCPGNPYTHRNCVWNRFRSEAVSVKKQGYSIHAQGWVAWEI